MAIIIHDNPRDTECPISETQEVMVAEAGISPGIYSWHDA